MKLLIDTNVILDILLKREPFFEASYQVIKRSQTICELCFSASAATDIFYILRKALGNDKAKEKLSQILQLFHCVDTQKSDIIKALNSQMTDFEDAVVDSVAQRIKASCIITRNVKDYAGSKIKALTPAEYLSKC